MSRDIEKTQGSKPGQYLTFILGTEYFGTGIECVREINRVGDITPVPKTPGHVKGVMNLRGKIIPVVQLAMRFGMEEKPHTRDTCIIVIDTPTGQVGMIVDAVREVITLQTQQIETAPNMGSTEMSSFVRGMGKLEDRVLILVDVVNILGEVNQMATELTAA